MWTLDDVSGVDASAMDGRRSNPSYEAGFDLCDPLGSVIWSDVPGRSAGRVLRRRCRSEGVDRSPYEDATREPLRSAEGYPRHRAQPNKSFFTLNNSPDRYVRECSLPTSNGDYLMAHEQNRHHGYLPARSKFNRTSPSRPLLVTTLSNTKVDDSRLPKVEELLEKIDQDMMELNTKTPLKSILNNPIPPPPGILKKPKGRIYQDATLNLEGRRRQRASSESDNLYCSFNLSSPIPGYDNRLAYLSQTNKRAKDNSGTGYSYGTAIATLGTTPRVTSPVTTKRCVCKEAHQSHSIEPANTNNQHMHLLRTTAITNEKREVDVSRQDTPTPTCPAVSPALPVSSVTSMPVPKKAVKKKTKQKVTIKVKPSVIDKRGITTDEDKAVRARSVKKKTKKKVASKVKPPVKGKRGITRDEDTDQSRSPSPDALKKATWRMETDTLIELVNKAQPRSVKSSDVTESESKVSSKSNGLLTNGSVTSEALSSVNGLTTSETYSTGASNGDVANGGGVAPKVISKVITNSEQSFMAALHTTNPFKVHSVRKDAILHLPDSISSCLRKSLFPRVPPYLKFVGHDEPANLKIPLAIQKHLKWKMTTITPIVVKKTLTNSGFRIVKSECDTAECPQEETVDWIGIWGKHMKSLMFRAIKDGQKMNHFPGTFQIGRKDRLWRNLQKLVVKYGKKEFGIMPKTYVLPHDIKLLKHDWDRYAANNERWIIKPPASARGTGIKVVSRWTQIPKKRPVVVQRYVSKPYLINGNKFDMRLYVLVTSVHPLRIYLFKDGLARFASVKYNEELTSLNDRYMHLTNYSINRLSKNYTPNEDFAATEGHKWTLQTLFQYLRVEKHVDTDALWDSIKDLVVKTIISGEASISSLTKANITSRYNCYELFGIDVLLDENLKPWLLEVNISPSLHSASPLDIHVKGPLVSCVLNIAQFQVPLKVNLEALSREKPNKLVPPKATETVPEEKAPRLGGLPYDSRLYTVYLSKEERDKHIIYTNMEERDMYLRDILSTLTPDDVRHLIQAEDELSQVGDMERIFPTRETHRYLAFLAGPRYYNRLFDAWETRYAQYREPGVELLRTLCDIGYHLEVPPVPLKVWLTPRKGTLLTLGNEWVNYEKDELDTDLPCHENDVDAPSPEASERPSVPSLGSVESSGPALVARPRP